MYMSLGSIFTAASLGSSAVRANAGVASVANTSGGNDVGASSGPVHHVHHHHGGEGPMMQDMMQVLGQMGLGAPAQSTATGGTSGDASSKAGAAVGDLSAESRQAMHAMLHDLFQAMHANGAPPNAAGASYGSVGNSLQSVIDGLKSNAAAPSGDSPLGKLQTDFDKLMQTLGASGASGSAGDAGAQSLQAFLQVLEKNAARHGSLPGAVGNGFVTRA